MNTKNLFTNDQAWGIVLVGVILGVWSGLVLRKMEVDYKNSNLSPELLPQAIDGANSAR